MPLERRCPADKHCDRQGSPPSIFRLALGCVGSLALLCASALARAETLVLLTENLVPFSMAVNGGNFAKNDGISGISTDTVRAACERAQIECQLILRFPWDRVYQQALSEPGYGVFSTARTPEREDKFKWVGPLAVNDWVLMARGDGSIHLNSLEDAARYRIGGYKNDAISQHLVDRGLQVQWRCATTRTSTSWPAGRSISGSPPIRAGATSPSARASRR